MSLYYEDRVIVFLDILGFKQHIDKTKIDAIHEKKINRILNFINKIGIENSKDKYGLKKTANKEVSVFSDSIVISYPTNHLSAVFYLLIDVVHIQLELMAQGILVRGGITIGKLYHENGVIYGPAMNKAYEIESKDAIYPRVVVDHNILIKGMVNINHSLKQEWNYISDLIEMDDDKQLYVDFMSQWTEFDEVEYYFKSLKTIKELIQNEIKLGNNPNILLKYNWLRSYYHKSICKLRPEFRKGLFI